MNKLVNLSILFFGTPEFALPALGALIKNGYGIVGVITRPDERVGRKQILTPPPVKILAEHHGIPVFQPERLDARDFAAGKIPRADLFIVAAYGKIIPKDILEIPQYGALNIHPSLLPRWRGPSPIQYTILNGDTETGVTIMKMDEKMDHGPIVSSIKYQVSSIKIIYRELHDELAKAGAKLLIETLPLYLDGKITPVPQDDAQATYSKILTRDDGRIDWQKSADGIERMIRAFTPWPGAWTLWPTGEKILRVRIEKAEQISAGGALQAGGPGFVRTEKNNPIVARTGDGFLAAQRIGVEGKKITDADSFLRGYPQVIGASFI